MVWDITGTGAVGYFGAELQYEKYKEVVTEIKTVDPQFTVTALVTDNENTMKSLRNLVRGGGDDASGCGPHAMNKALGLYIHYTILYFFFFFVSGIQRNIAV